MATLTLRPNADIVTQLGQFPDSGNHYEKVDEGGGGDGDATYVASPVDWNYDLYGLPNHTTESGTINKITVFIRHKRVDIVSTVARGRTVIKIGGTEHRGVIEDPGLAYHLDPTEYVQNPTTIAAWTWADIDNLQAGIDEFGFETEKESSTLHCTQVWVDVDHTPPAADPRRSSFFKMF